MRHLATLCQSHLLLPFTRAWLISSLCDRNDQLISQPTNWLTLCTVALCLGGGAAQLLTPRYSVPHAFVAAASVGSRVIISAIGTLLLPPPTPPYEQITKEEAGKWGWWKLSDFQFLLFYYVPLQTNSIWKDTDPPPAHPLSFGLNNTMNVLQEWHWY